jgi:nitrogen fixation protein
MEVTITPTNFIGVGGYIIITFNNQFWFNEIPQNNSLPITASMACSSNTVNYLTI